MTKKFSIKHVTILITSLLFFQNAFAGELSQKLKEKSEASKAKRPDEITKVMKKGLDDLRKLGLHKKALGVGKKAPKVQFTDQKGKSVDLKSLYKDQTLVLTFYRGGWCPYCMLELDAYQKMISQFQKAGAMIVAVSPDTQKEVSKTIQKRGITYSVMSDPNNSAAKEFGIAFKVDTGTLQIYKKFGIDLEGSQNNQDNELPMPGTYVIDKNGVIRYSFVDPDYTKRADPEDVLKILKGI